MNTFSKYFIQLLVTILFVSSTVASCPVCYGNAQSPVLDGMNNAVVTMLGFTGFVFSGFITLFFYIRKRIVNK